VPHRPGVLVDVVYQPWPSPLADTWTAQGGRAVGGLELLVHQAVEQVRLMTGHTVPAAFLREAGSAELARRS
jgi:shikimate dehydrogenase